jgi:predicted RNase H-like nuclease (RuvC/YqgF family)
METEQQNENVTLLYIQKQEQCIIDYVRKQLDYEIKLHLMNDKLNQHIEKIKELSTIIDNQNSIVSQASNSIEMLTEENRNLQNINSSYKEKIEKLEKTIFDIDNDLRQHKKMNESNNKKIADLQIELDRQNDELTGLYNPNKKKPKKVQDETF